MVLHTDFTVSLLFYLTSSVQSAALAAMISGANRSMCPSQTSLDFTDIGDVFSCNRTAKSMPGWKQQYCNGIQDCDENIDETLCFSDQFSYQEPNEPQPLVLGLLQQSGHWCDAAVCVSNSSGLAQGQAVQSLAHVFCRQRNMQLASNITQTQTSNLTGLPMVFFNCRHTDPTVQSCLWRGGDLSTTDCANVLSVSCSDECDYNLQLKSGETGTITSPGYPTLLLPKLYCSWTLNAPIGHIISLKFDTMNIEPTLSGLIAPNSSKPCASPGNVVKVIVGESGTSQNPFTLHRLCHATATDSTFSSPSQLPWLRIQLRTSDLTQQLQAGSRGFSVTYSVVSADQPSGYLWDWPRGKIIGHIVLIVLLLLLSFVGCCLCKYRKKNSELATRSRRLRNMNAAGTGIKNDPDLEIIWHDIMNLTKINLLAAEDNATQFLNHQSTRPIQCPICFRSSTSFAYTCMHLRRTLLTVFDPEYIGLPRNEPANESYVEMMTAEIGLMRSASSCSLLLPMSQTAQSAPLTIHNGDASINSKRTRPPKVPRRTFLEGLVRERDDSSVLHAVINRVKSQSEDDLDPTYVSIVELGSPLQNRTLSLLDNDSKASKKNRKRTLSSISSVFLNSSLAAIKAVAGGSSAAGSKQTGKRVSLLSRFNPKTSTPRFRSAPRQRTPGNVIHSAEDVFDDTMDGMRSKPDRLAVQPSMRRFKSTPLIIVHPSSMRRTAHNSSGHLQSPSTSSPQLPHRASPAFPHDSLSSISSGAPDSPRFPPHHLLSVHGQRRTSARTEHESSLRRSSALTDYC